MPFVCVRTAPLAVVGGTTFIFDWYMSADCSEICVWYWCVGCVCIWFACKPCKILSWLCSVCRWYGCLCVVVCCCKWLLLANCSNWCKNDVIGGWNDAAEWYGGWCCVCETIEAVGIDGISGIAWDWLDTGTENVCGETEFLWIISLQKKSCLLTSYSLCACLLLLLLLFIIIDGFGFHLKKFYVKRKIQNDMQKIRTFVSPK